MSNLKDGGTRRATATGALKEDNTKTEGKGAYDLFPTIPIRKVAEIYRKGSLKYNARNWEKGICLSRFIDSAKRHIDQFIEGMEDEDHLHQAIWNLLGLSHTIEMINRGLLAPSLNDLPSYGKNGVNIEIAPGIFCDKWREPGPGLNLPYEQKGLWFNTDKKEEIQLTTTEKSIYICTDTIFNIVPGSIHQTEIHNEVITIYINMLYTRELTKEQLSEHFMKIKTCEPKIGDYVVCCHDNDSVCNNNSIRKGNVFKIRSIDIGSLQLAPISHPADWDYQYNDIYWPARLFVLVEYKEEE